MIFQTYPRIRLIIIIYYRSLSNSGKYGFITQSTPVGMRMTPEDEAESGTRLQVVQKKKKEKVRTPYFLAHLKLLYSFGAQIVSHEQAAALCS